VRRLPVRPHEGERLYRLRDDPPAAADPPPGRLRAATPDDLALLLAWSGLGYEAVAEITAYTFG
jgi:hypothetical protein